MTVLTPTLTPAADDEMADIAALVNAAYRGDSARAGWTSEADLLEGVRTDAARLRADLAATPGACLLVARDAAGDADIGPVIGCVWVEPQGAGIWFLGMLTVRPDLQDRKLGRTLMDGAEAHVRAAGGTVMRLSVLDVRDTLIAYYERRGYARTGETAPFPYVDPPRPELRFAYLEKRL